MYLSLKTSSQVGLVVQACYLGGWGRWIRDTRPDWDIFERSFLKIEDERELGI